MPFASHEAYFETVPPETRQRLEAIQTRVEALLPGVTRCIGYQIPAFRDGRIFFCFAAFQNHIGIYPPVTQDAALIRELAPYRGAKGNLSFPHNQPLPLELIGRVALALHFEYDRQ
ncbi:MAG: hypothetical protein KatS3mg073_1286 [Meiothermus sp.]|nr:MAG: hypothetical protein KatS3mg073_1286 [Meiothermus sp.]